MPIKEQKGAPVSSTVLHPVGVFAVNSEGGRSKQASLVYDIGDGTTCVINPEALRCIGTAVLQANADNTKLELLMLAVESAEGDLLSLHGLYVWARIELRLRPNDARRVICDATDGLDRSAVNQGMNDVDAALTRYRRHKKRMAGNASGQNAKELVK